MQCNLNLNKRIPMRIAIAAAAAALVTQSFALNIVVTNDDGYQTVLLNKLVEKLKAANHEVVVSAPCGHQSGSAGSIRPYLKAIPVKALDYNASGILEMTTTDAVYGTHDYICVGDTDESKPFSEFASGTPVHASLNGIAMADEKWGRGNYIVLSGPNEGQNLGAMVFHSGTLGATHVSLSQGIPTIALSADSEDEDATYAGYVADKTLELLNSLVASQKSGEPLLPARVGFNVNFPDVEVMSATTEFKLTKVNWANGGYRLKFGSLNEVGDGETCYGTYYGYADADDSVRGLNYCVGIDYTGDTDSNSEGNVVKKDGYISISTIDATENAPEAKSAYTKMRLNALVD
jgi:5'-nucleotidase